MISRRTLAQFGARLTPHSFRHAAATTIAQNRPEEALVIRLILGHSTTATAEQHYIHATRINAANRYQRIVEGRRAATRNQNATRRARAVALTCDDRDGTDSR